MLIARTSLSSVILLVSCFLNSAVAQDEALDSEVQFGAPVTAAAPNVVEPEEVEAISNWEFIAPLAIPAIEPANLDAGLPLAELILGPDVFTNARPDLADLRLIDSVGKIHPYSLRTLAPQSIRDSVPRTEFNRMTDTSGMQELTLELTPENAQHNELQLVTTGKNFRRAVEIDGSEDGTLWRRITQANLIRFADGNDKVDVDSIRYLDSRLPFIRVRIHPDPNIDSTGDEKDEFEISEARIVRSIELPGERIQWDALIGPREPTRVNGAAGSSWIIDLQGKNVPCDQLVFDVEGREFVREVELQVEMPYGAVRGMVFVPVYVDGTTTWQRKLGDAKESMVIKFTEVPAGRMRLRVADYRNAPLRIRSATASASARQIVFNRATGGSGGLSLYMGNPTAELPNYDFARNLPKRFEIVPVRARLQSILPNPDFIAPSKPFSERFPWLIYVVLAAISIALLVLIASVARTAIQIHDRQAKTA